MRTKFIDDKKMDARLLSVKPSWREHILYEELEWVESVPNRFMAQVRHESRGKVNNEIYYTLTGMRKLKDVLNDENSNIVQTVLISCADVIATCILDGVDAGLIYFDSSWIYVRQDGCPQYMYIPIDRNMHHCGHNSLVPEGHLIKLIDQLANASNKCWNQYSETQRRILLGMSQWPLSELTLRSFSAVLENDLGYSLTPVTAEAIRVLNGRDPNYGRNLHSRAGSLEQYSQGTWRGINSRGSMEAFRREVGIMPGHEGDHLIIKNTNNVEQQNEWNSVINSPKLGPIAELNTSTHSYNECFIIVRQSDGSSCQFVDGQSVHLGRGYKNEMQILGNPKISREHAVVECRYGNLYLYDLGSVNGTWLSGKRLAPKYKTPISIGQHFSLANEGFIIKIV